LGITLYTTRGAGIWVADGPDRATRALGSLLGLHANYGWMWYHWREGHEYFMNSFSVFLWATALVADAIYPFAFAYVRKIEKVGPDGRKMAGDLAGDKRKKSQ